MKQAIQTQRKGLRQPAVVAWLRLARVFQKISTLSERSFRMQDLNTGQFDVLAQIGAAPGISQQELASALLVTKGNISQLLSKMEREGLVRRQQEGRTNCLSLTAEGQALFDRVVPQQEALIADALSPLSSTEQTELVRLLRKLDHTLAP
ncbi:MAG: MarR family transcriptional regulator [Herpetosiphonaceae bacterium]|nr:MarR family transcriptional regulator [Herpetosiphonaceae bacterium]